MKYDYSFIVPAFNEEKLLAATIANLNSIIERLNNRYLGRVIVVDNNSKDNTAKIAKDMGAEVVFEPINCIARARNSGAKIAKSRYLIFVDADTLVSYEIVKKSLENLSSGTICGGGAHVEFDFEKIPFFAKLTIIWWNTVTFLVPLAAGSYLYCLSEGWKAVGGFNEKLYASEEVNFSYKLKKWGRKNKQKFILLPDKVLTSGRKMGWYSSFHLFVYIMLGMLFPFMLRSRKACYLWYTRPEE